MPAAMWRRANSREQKNVPLSVMSTTVRQALGDMSSAGTGKLAAALLTRTPGRPKAASAASKAAAICSGSRMSQVTVSTRPPASVIGRRAGLEVLGLAAGDDDVRTEPGELDGDGLAQAGAGTGDEHRHAVEGARGQGGGPGRRRFGQSGQAGRVGHLGQLPL